MKIALIGYGKMGKTIEQIAVYNKHEIVLKVDEFNAKTFSAAELAKADVAIEFSRPDAAFENVLKCFEANVPVVCGTTGWKDRIEEAKKICIEKNQSFFYASNFSVGVNIFFEINRRLAEMMNKQNSYNEIWITETHHSQKLDTPSGTAITLAEDMLKNIDRLNSWKNYHAASMMDKNEENDFTILPINSLRVGEVAGLHEINYESDDDSIQIIHQAKSRNGFAKGALMAAEFIIGKKGVYTMKDLLNF